jgi:hypothetical protein
MGLGPLLPVLLYFVKKILQKVRGQLISGIFLKFKIRENRNCIIKTKMKDLKGESLKSMKNLFRTLDNMKI